MEAIFLLNFWKFQVDPDGQKTADSLTRVWKSDENK